jgi:hypothetical protein
VIVYISIGNSDDKLSQQEWCGFVNEVSEAIRGVANFMHGSWFSESAGPWQNACWCAEINGPDRRMAWLRDDLARIAQSYRQDSITWAEVPEVEFIRPGAQ